MNEIETVESFLSALGEMDMGRVLDLASPDIVYQNVPLAPARGLAAFEKQMQTFAKIADGFEVTTRHIAANGPFVLTERTDAFVIGRGRAEFWVCGTFEVREGRIALWRDYFDWAQVSMQTARVLPRALLKMLSSRGSA